MMLSESFLLHQLQNNFKMIIKISTIINENIKRKKDQYFIMEHGNYSLIEREMFLQLFTLPKADYSVESFLLHRT